MYNMNVVCSFRAKCQVTPFTYGAGRKVVVGGG